MRLLLYGWLPFTVPSRTPPLLSSTQPAFFNAFCALKLSITGSITFYSQSTQMRGPCKEILAREKNAGAQAPRPAGLGSES